MTTLLPLLPGLVLSLIPVCGSAVGIWHFRLRGEGWRSAVLASAVCCGLVVAFSTELLSAFRLVTQLGLVVSWSLVDLAALILTLRLRRQVRTAGPAEDTTQPPLKQVEYIFIGGIGLILLLVGLTALLAPPNTWDVVSYHLSRVALWKNNRDVHNYPTFYSAQLFLSPWAEYCILHAYVLAGGDYFANLVEWLSMTGLIAAGSLVAEELGAGVRGQLLAAVSCATIPGLILESSGSMNTGVVAFWIVATVYYLLRAGKSPGWWPFLGAGATAGLAAFTKGTAYIFLPLLCGACWFIAEGSTRRLLLTRLPAAAVLFLGINGPLYVRNYQLSGSPFGFTTPLGQDEQRQYANSRHSVGITYANVIKNLALHLGTPLHGFNDRVFHVVRGSIRMFGIDPDDTAATYRNGFWIPATSTYESTAGSPVQCLIVLGAGVLLMRARYRDKRLILLLAASAGSFILFCALIRWQAWNARYQMPLICIGLCVAAVVLERWNSSVVVPAVALVALLYAAPFCVRNSLRPLAPWKNTSLFRRHRTDFYFEDGHPNLEKSYQFANDEIRKGSCRDVGVDSSLEDFEYPLLAMLTSGGSDVRVRYYQVRNLTAGYVRPEDRLAPCAVICLRCAMVPAKWAEYRDIGGRASVFDEIAVFGKDAALENNQAFRLSEIFQAEDALAKLDKSRDALGFAIATSPDSRSRIDQSAQKVLQAGRNWPAKALELDQELSAIATLSYAAWRVRDSVDPMLRAGQHVDYSQADQLQFAAAAELLESWRTTIPARFDHLDDRVGQLSVDWELRSVAAPIPIKGRKNACRLTVEKILRPSDLNAAAGRTVVNRRDIEVDPCSCLQGRTAPGSIIATKTRGKFDAEAEKLTACSW